MELACGARQAPSVTGHDLAGAAVQVAGARVVAEPRPGGEHVVERAFRKSLDGREATEPALEERHHRGHSSLLEHDLGDPYPVGIARLAPGQVALMGAEVREHAARDLSAVVGVGHEKEEAGVSPGLVRSVCGLGG